MESSWRWILITAFAPVVWGSTYLVTRSTMPADFPLWGATWRSLPAAVVLLLVVRALPKGSWWWKSLVLGTMNIGAFFVLLYVAAQTLPSSVASSIMAASPVVMMLVAWALISERPTARALLGAGLGICGVVLIVSAGSGAVNWGGVAASVSAMVMSAVGFVLAKRWSGQVPILHSTTWQVMWAGGLLALVSLIVEGPSPRYALPAVAGFAYVSIAATAVAYLAWFTGLRHLRAGTVGVVGLLNPVSGVLLGVLVGGESLSLAQAGGIVLVVLGIAIASWMPARPTRPHGPAPARSPAAGSISVT